VSFCTLPRREVLEKELRNSDLVIAVSLDEAIVGTSEEVFSGWNPEEAYDRVGDPQGNTLRTSPPSGTPMARARQSGAHPYRQVALRIWEFASRSILRWVPTNDELTTVKRAHCPCCAGLFILFHSRD
jgi:hypothetical protein